MRGPATPENITDTCNCPNSTQSDTPSRAALGIDKTIDILHHIRQLPTAEEQAMAVAKVRDVERRAMLEQQPQPGLLRLMDYLQSRSVRRALCTRNFESVSLVKPLIEMQSHTGTGR